MGWVKQHGSGWRVDTGRSRPRLRFNFATKAEAIAKEKEIRAERQTFGLKGTFTTEQRYDVMKALAHLEGIGAKVDLSECVRFWVAHKMPRAGRVPLRKLFDELAKDRANPDLDLRDGYRKSMAETLEPFVRDFETKPIMPGQAPQEVMADEITPDQVEAWISKHINHKTKKPSSAKTKSNLYTHIKMMFGFGVDKGYVGSSPVNFMNIWSRKRSTRPEILTLQQVDRLLLEAYSDWQRRREPDIFMYVVLGLYCGVRRDELLRLTAFSLRPKWIVFISEDEAKTKGFRSVKVPRNAQIMLQEIWDMHLEYKEWVSEDQSKDNEHEMQPNLVRSKNFRKRFEAVRKAAGIHPWPKNCLRHSFASYFFAVTQDKEMLLNRLGHSTDDVTFEHYLKPIDIVHPLDYFQIFPDKEHHYAWTAEMKSLLKGKGKNAPKVPTDQQIIEALDFRL